MYLWGDRKRCVERLVEAQELRCHNCGSDDLGAYEAEFPMGAATLNVTLKCGNCDAGNPFELTRAEYRDCGFDPDENLRQIDETY